MEHLALDGRRRHRFVAHRFNGEDVAIVFVEVLCRADENSSADQESILGLRESSSAPRETRPFGGLPIPRHERYSGSISIRKRGKLSDRNGSAFLRACARLQHHL